jgi:hypothetical protein
MWTSSKNNTRNKKKNKFLNKKLHYSIVMLNCGCFSQKAEKADLIWLGPENLVTHHPHLKAVCACLSTSKAAPKSLEGPICRIDAESMGSSLTLPTTNRSQRCFFISHLPKNSLRLNPTSRNIFSLTVCNAPFSAIPTLTSTHCFHQRCDPGRGPLVLPNFPVHLVASQQRSSRAPSIRQTLSPLVFFAFFHLNLPRIAVIIITFEPLTPLWRLHTSASPPNRTC